MSYITDNLGTNEKVISQAKIHWAVFIGPVISLLFALALSFYPFKDFTMNDVLGLISSDLETAGSPLVILGKYINYVGYLFLASALLRCVRQLLVYMTTEFALTNRRLMGKAGIISRTTLEVLLSKVESIHVDQSVMGRILNFGTVWVTGSGGTSTPFYAIANPTGLRTQINQEVEQRQNQQVVAQQPVAAPPAAAS